jgi:ATP-dependent Lon protease
MTRDSQSKKINKSVSKKKEDTKLKKRHNESSDSDYSENDEEDEEMDMQEYREFLSKTFPSKHLDKKVKSGKKLKQAIEEDVKEQRSKKGKNKKYETSDSEQDESEESDEEYIPKKQNKNKQKSSNKSCNKSSNKKKYISESEEEEEEDDEESEYESDEYEEEDDDVEVVSDKKKVKGKGSSSKFNIIFTIGGGRKNKDEYEDEYDDEEEEEDEWLTCSDDIEDTENEDDPVSTDEDTEDEEDPEDEEEDEQEEIKHKRTNKAKKIKQMVEVKEQHQEQIEDGKLKDDTITAANKINDEQNNILSVLKDLHSKDKNNDLITECIKVCEEKIKVNKKKEEKKNIKVKDRNDRIFKRILRDKNTMNDFEFFEKLEIDQQKKIIKELREINKITRVEKPYRLTLLEANIPLIFKSAALKKISSLRYMEPGSGEFYKIKNWVDTFMRIPFGKYNNLPISIDDGVEKCHDFMANAQKTLNDAVYGLNDAKMQIMQLLGQLVTNPKAIGTAIAIHGPPGTGKTSLVREGISKILDRPFAFIALGGATDSSFLEGHGYTYEGSTWGKIVQILIDSKCMNPVIYFDELDKISETPKGEEIAGILTHLTDTSQNSQFHDKYFAEIDFDLSKCLFIFSYNDESKVNPILKDRMYRIQTKGYNQKQKTVIANSYLLPKIQEQVRFNTEDIIIPDETVHYLIEMFCNKEDGIRNLKRCLEIIYTKLNLYRLMRADSNLFEEDMALKVEFPFKVTKDIVDKLIKTNKENISALHSLYV